MYETNGFAKQTLRKRNIGSSAVTVVCRIISKERDESKGCISNHISSPPIKKYKQKLSPIDRYFMLSGVGSRGDACFVFESLGDEMLVVIDIRFQLVVVVVVLFCF